VISDAGGSVEEWRSLRIGRSGPMEDVDLCGDRATALIEDIWCEKIRGCSYGARASARRDRTGTTAQSPAYWRDCRSMRKYELVMERGY